MCRLTVSVTGGQRLHSARYMCRTSRRRPSGRRGNHSGSRIEVNDVGLNPTRTALLGVLERFGARVQVDVDLRRRGPRGSVTVEGDQWGRWTSRRQSARPDRRTSGTRGAGGARRSGDGARRERAARQTIASPRWSPGSARASMPRSSPTIIIAGLRGIDPAVRRTRRRAQRSPYGDGVCDCRPGGKGPLRSLDPTSSRSPIRLLRDAGPAGGALRWARGAVVWVEV
jgi:hypothetical protein